MTTVVAWLALLVSSASLGWQVLVWKKSGARVVVHLEQANAFSGGEMHSVVVVVATNVGRVATTINEVGLNYYHQKTGEKIDYRDVKQHVAWESNNLPKRLESGEAFKTSFRPGGGPFLGLDKSVNMVMAQGYVRMGLEHVFSPQSITLSSLFG